MAASFLDWLTSQWTGLTRILKGVHKRVAESLLASKSKRKGTKLAIVGPPASGKTVVHTFLSSGVLLTEYSPTLGVQKQRPTKVEIETVRQIRDGNPIHLYLAERYDMSGDYKRFPDVWARALNDAFFVVFLYDAQKFLGENSIAAKYRREVVDACDFAGGLIKYPDTKVVLAGTHCDLINGWNLTRQSITKIDRQISKYDEAEQARIHLGKKTKDEASVVYGSLKDAESATELLYSIFESEG
jgi:GTPase SAR1 family protein